MVTSASVLKGDAAPQISGAQSIRRAVDLLRAVATMQRQGANLAALARLTQLNRSTAFRILRSLCEEGLLEFDEPSSCYTIGRLAYELGLAARDGAQLVAPWRDVLARVQRSTGMTTYLVARSDLEVVCLAIVQGSGAVRAVPLEVGERLPLGVGGGSLAILSGFDDEEVAAVLNANAKRLALYGDGQLTAAEITRRVEAARKNGYAQSRNAVVSGVVGLGMCVAEKRGLAQLAISISIPNASLSAAEEARLVGLMRQELAASR